MGQSTWGVSYKMLKKRLIAIIILCSFSFINTEDQKKKPKSALKWISHYQAKTLPFSWSNPNFVKGRYNYIAYCRAEVDGCFYPGEAYLGQNGRPWNSVELIGIKDTGYPECRIITKEKVYPPQSSFEVLYNPEGVANYAWRPWPKGTDNLNFPLGVVKSDDSCNLMIGRYNDYKEVALVDGTGHVFYNHGPNYPHGPGEGWYWDNNEYDLLIERSVKKIELLELDYKEPIDKRTSRFEGEVESPGKALLGGAKATYKFETSFSYSHGWGSGNDKSRWATQTVTKNVPAMHKIRIKLFMMQNIVDVPYTAKYRVTYEDGSTKIVKDEGVMKNVFYSDSQVDIGVAEPI